MNDRQINLELIRPGDSSRDEQAAAALTCADHARDGDELLLFLDMLGLRPPKT